jgi:hypothetical protein
MAMQATDRTLIEFFRENLLHPEVIAAATKNALRQLIPSQESLSGQKRELTIRVAPLDEELSHLTTAVVNGGNVPTLVTAIKERERQKNEAHAAMTRLDSMGQVTQLDARRLEEELRDRVTEWQGILSRHVTQARQILKKLLAGRIRFDPNQDGEQRIYKFSGKATIVKVLAGTVCSNALASPPGGDQIRNLNDQLRDTVAQLVTKP